MVQFARRMTKLHTVASLEMLAKATELERMGKEIIHLEIGEPDFNTPENVKKAGINAIINNFSHYSPASGFPKLREAIAEHISTLKKITVTPDEVVVTSGAKPVMYYAITLFAQRGDEILYPNPGYPVFESIISFCDAKPVPIPLLEKNNFGFDLEQVKTLITPRTKMIILNSPSNPTGTIMTKKDMETIAEIAIKNDLVILSDEIYSEFTYGEEYVTIASLPGMKERTIILNGLSKSYAMTGWRLGWGIMNKEIAKMMNRLNGNITSCASTISQMAALEAMTGDRQEVNKMIEEFKVRRDIMVNGLNKIPNFRTIRPQGAFYVFPNIQKTGMTSLELAEYLLNEAGVALLPGCGFGKYGEGYLRLSYANSRENIEKALDRINEAMKKHKILTKKDNKLTIGGFFKDIGEKISKLGKKKN